MKNHLLGLVAVATMTITTPLILIENFSKNNETVSLEVTKLNHDESGRYYRIRNSQEYRRFQSDFKHLKWHAEHWQYASVPFYGLIFYGEFVKYHNDVIDAMNKIISQNQELHMIALENQPTIKTVAAVALGIIGLASSSGELQDYFHRCVKRQYESIVSIISRNN